MHTGLFVANSKNPLYVQSRHGFDWLVIFILIALSLSGLFFIYSTTYTADRPYSIFFKKQSCALIGGIIAYITFFFIDYRAVIRWGYFGYYGVLIVLSLTLFLGHIGMGAQRWIGFSWFKVQPSEVAKFFLPLHISHYLDTQPHNYNVYLSFTYLLCHLVTAFFLIARQPDLGTALVVLASGFIMLFRIGIPSLFFTIILCLGICGAPVLWHGLKPYQQRRILVFLGHGTPLKERYQTEQSIIAIGSGGLFGKGFLKGTQHTLHFLPESRTDFIFAVICEEWGLCGALLLLLFYSILFFILMWRISSIAHYSYHIAAIGLLAPIILACTTNIGMVIGLLPIVGIPLPFISYGLNNLLINCASLGLIQGIIYQQFSMRTHKNFV